MFREIAARDRGRGLAIIPTTSTRFSAILVCSNALGREVAAISKTHHVRLRRQELARQFDVSRQMAKIEETCVPSYLHRNVLASGVAWWRLFVAEGFYRKFAPQGDVLDFGAATGELGHLLPASTAYEFIEADEDMARTLRAN
jgi:hypothetical protein